MAAKVKTRNLHNLILFELIIKSEWQISPYQNNKNVRILQLWSQNLPLFQPLSKKY
jgi:hypothetical protein